MPRRWYDDDYNWPKHVSVAERRNQAAREAAKLVKKGRALQPVILDGFKVAKTFWGKAWCDNLERYSDYANRLPRGRSYLRNGSVIDLQIATGTVTALVSGSRVYEIEVKVTPVPRLLWKAICTDCSGAIDSVIELLKGQFSNAVMSRLCQENTGLFPSPLEIKFRCSCPDSAQLCKHLASVLYGIGARLDEKPELLFVLRNVNQQELIAHAAEGMVNKKKPKTGQRVLDDHNLSDIFGIDIASTPKRKRTNGAATKRHKRLKKGKSIL